MTVGDFGNGRHVVDLQKRVGEHFRSNGLGRTSMRIALGGFAGHRRIERLVIRWCPLPTMTPQRSKYSWSSE